MNIDDWLLVIGEEQTREWGGREYRFRVGQEHQEANPIFRELQSNTPLRSLIEKSAEDGQIRGLLFLSYYLINPTFRKEDTETGTNFFSIPLDDLDEETYERLNEDFGDSSDSSESEEQEEEDEEEVPIPDFPLMSTVSEPIIEAATSERYTKQLGRKSEKSKREVLQEEIERKKKEQVEEVEEWLKEGFDGEQFRTQFSQFTEATSLFPTLFLINLLIDEKARFSQVRDRIDSLDIFKPETWDEELLSCLNNLSEDVQVFENNVIEGFCLDKKNTGCEFHIVKHRGLELGDSLRTCESCGSQLFRVYRAGLEERVRDAWMMGLLPELATAATLQRCDWVDEAIPHRMVQMTTEDGVTSSEEVDITVHTTSDEVFFFEVTAQADNAMGRINGKREKFDDSGIEYDALIQISLADNRDFIPFGEKTLSGAGWMIPNMHRTEFIESIRTKLDN